MAEDGASLLDDWRQGDLTLTPLDIPVLTMDDGELAIQAIAAEHGAALVSQSCDIIRDVSVRPYVQIAPLVRATEAELARAAKGASPTRIHLPTLEKMGFLIDLEATATVHKEVVAGWDRASGCATDEERRELGMALGRHRHRFAFPEDFNLGVKPFRKWVEQKWKKASHHGGLIRATREVRVRCDDWSEPTSILFLIILDEQFDATTMSEWRAIVKDLETKLRDGIPDPEVKIVTYDQISARDYVTSDRLDWEGLSDA